VRALAPNPSEERVESQASALHSGSVRSLDDLGERARDAVGAGRELADLLQSTRGIDLNLAQLSRARVLVRILNSYVLDATESAPSMEDSLTEYLAPLREPQTTLRIAEAVTTEGKPRSRIGMVQPDGACPLGGTVLLGIKISDVQEGG